MIKLLNRKRGRESNTADNNPAISNNYREKHAITVSSENDFTIFLVFPLANFALQLTPPLTLRCTLGYYI